MRFSSVVLPAVIALAANVNAAPLHVTRSTEIEARGGIPGLSSILNAFKTIFRGVPREIDAREPADIDSLLELVSREPEPAVALNLALPELDARGGVPPLGSILKALLNVFKAKRDLDSRAEPTDEDIAKMLVAAAMLQGRDLDELEARGGVPGLSSILSALKNIFRGVPRELGARAEPTDEDIAQLLVAAAMLQGRDVEELDARGGVPALGSILSALKNIFRGVPRELGARAEPTDEDIAKLLVVAMLQGRDVEDLDARGGVPALGSILSALKNIFRGVPRELGARAEPTDEDIAKLLVAAMLQGRDIGELDARGGVPALGSILSALKNIFRGVPRELGARAEPTDEDIAKLLVAAMLQGRDIGELDARGGVPALGSILSALKNIFRGVPRDLDARGGVPPLGSILKALLNVFKAKRDGAAPTEEQIAQMLIAAMLQG